MTKIINYSILFCLICLIGSSCKKGAGEGGKATITGKVYAYNYNSTLKADSGFIGDYKVYINYGDATGISNDVATDYNGNFNFNYLRKGKYTVWVYTKIDSVLYQIDSSIVRTIEITKSSETIDLGTIKVTTRKN